MRIGAVALVLGMSPSALFAQGVEPAFERPILQPGSGLVSVRLDRHVYEAARRDLGDLRIRDERGRGVPYVLDQDDAPSLLEEWLEPRWSRAFVDEARETWLTLDLGARYQPVRAVVLEVEDRRFRREVRVEARDEPVLRSTDAVAPAERWRSLGSGSVSRLEEGGEIREDLRVEVVARARMVRLRIEDRDDRPLRVSGVTAVAPAERLIFEATGGIEYRLTYGAPELLAPSYDLAHTLGDDVEAQPVEIGPPVRRDVEADVLPWTERHPAFLWVGLVLVVAALGALTWSTLRAA